MLIRHELRHARALGAVSACLLLVACGLKGPLFMRPEPANFPPIAPLSAVKPVCRAPVTATAVAPAAVTSALPVCLPVPTTNAAPVAATGTPPRP